MGYKALQTKELCSHCTSLTWTDGKIEGKRFCGAVWSVERFEFMFTVTKIESLRSWAGLDGRISATTSLAYEEALRAFR